MQAGCSAGVGGVPRPTSVGGPNCRVTLGGAGGCMLCRAGRVPTGGARSPVGTGAVKADERVAAAAVGAVEAPTAAGCGTGGATNVTGLAEAGGGVREPGEEGGVATLFSTEGGGRRALLGVDCGDPGLALKERCVGGRPVAT